MESYTGEPTKLLRSGTISCKISPHFDHFLYKFRNLLINDASPLNSYLMYKKPYLFEYKIFFQGNLFSDKIFCVLSRLLYGLLYEKGSKATKRMHSDTLCKQEDSVLVALSLYIWSDKFEIKSFSLVCESFYTNKSGCWQVHFTIESFFAVLSWIVEVQAIYGFLYWSCRSSYAVSKSSVGNK